jgi:thioredoxin
MNTSQQTAVHVACLCAAWCRLCEGYAAIFDEVVAWLRTMHPRLVVHWIDIEDEAALVGDLDVETFPTLVVVDDARVRFAGPLMPHPEVLRRVLGAALTGSAPYAGLVAPEVEDFAARLRQRAPEPPPG